MIRKERKATKIDVYECTALKARVLAKNESLDRKNLLEKVILFYDTYKNRVDVLPNAVEMNEAIRFLAEENKVVKYQIGVLMKDIANMQDKLRGDRHDKEGDM
jgi:hypothetical protein